MFFHEIRFSQFVTGLQEEKKNIQLHTLAKFQYMVTFLILSTVLLFLLF